MERADSFKLRRRLAIGVIAAFILIPVYMLFIRDDGGSEPSQSALVQATQDPNKAAEVLLDQVSDPSQGITIRFPSGWTGERTGSIVRATSHEGKTAVAVTTGGPADSARTVFRDTTAAIAADYEKPKVSLVPARDALHIAGLNTAGASVSGRLKKGGAQSTTLLYVVQGKRRAYVVSLITPQDATQLAAGNLILARGLTLSG
ncbi:MAG: hypothetical protein QOD60_1517 [Solirubrobacterales bacterium]|nr:hypothetical protein [Solirubrobacterales bacterium]